MATASVTKECLLKDCVISFSTTQSASGKTDEEARGKADILAQFAVADHMEAWHPRTRS
jgi:hypothetical protein